MLSADAITKTYRATSGRVVAVEGASLAVAPGARVGLVGPSGSGKSTLAQVMAMLLAPDSGSVTIDGDRVEEWGVRCSRELRHRVQLIFQSPRMSVDPRLRIGDAILAEGQLQRACLARALVVAPRYLICDELSSMLDVSTQAALLETIAAVQDEQELGVLLITHDRVLADTWCGEIADIRELSAPGEAQEARAIRRAGNDALRSQQGSTGRLCVTVSPDRLPVVVADLDEAMDVVRRRGLRLTSARRLVLEALLAARGPISAEDIADGLGGRMTQSDIASVYRNLETLGELGLVRHFHAGHGPGRYVLEGLGDREYLACESCGALESVEPAALDGVRDAVRDLSGFEARFSHFPIVGLCARCAKQRKGRAGRGASKKASAQP